MLRVNNQNGKPYEIWIAKGPSGFIATIGKVACADLALQSAWTSNDHEKIIQVVWTRAKDLGLEVTEEQIKELVCAKS
jgi:hypothetical protein